MMALFIIEFNFQLMFAAVPMGLPKTIVIIVGYNTVVGRLLNFADLKFYNN